MKLTVIIPAHNDEDHLHRLLRHLRQLKIASHVIITDDGSAPAIRPEPLAAAAGLPATHVTLLRQDQPRGAGAARNLALPHVTTEHLLFLDADDLPLRELSDLLRDLDGKRFDFCLFQHHDSRRSATHGWGQMTADQRLWRAAGTDVGALSPVSEQAAAHLCQTANYPWNKIYRTAFLRDHDIHCTEIAVHNDMELHWRSFFKADTILASDRICVLHYVTPQLNRLTNRNGVERLAVFTALRRISGELRQQHALARFHLPFCQFASGLLHWINGFIRPDLRPELLRLTHAFAAEEIPPQILACLTASDADAFSLPPAPAAPAGTPVPASASPAAAAAPTAAPQPQIWLHPGLPKCGSTSLQRHLAQNAAQHRAQGVCYPTSWRSPDGYRNHLPLAKLPPQMLSQALAEIIAEAQDQGCQRIVLSCEHWTNALPRGSLAMLHQTLRQQLPDWQLRVVAYFRNPYDFVESCYAQYIRAGLFQINRHVFYADGQPSIEKFLHHFEDSWGFPLYSNLHLARQLQRIIPPEDLLLRSLEPSDLSTADMLADFCSLLDLPPPASSRHRNQRVSPQKLAELEYIQTLTDQDSYARLRPQLLEQPSAVPPAAEAETLRGDTTHISADIAAAISRQIADEAAQLQQMFSTSTGQLCAQRSGDETGGWLRRSLLSDQDRAQLRAFVADNTPLRAAR